MICSLSVFSPASNFLYDLLLVLFRNSNFLHDLFPGCFSLASNFLRDLFPVLWPFWVSGSSPGGSELPNGTPERMGVALGLFGTLSFLPKKAATYTSCWCRAGSIFDIGRLAKKVATYTLCWCCAESFFDVELQKGSGYLPCGNPVGILCWHVFLSRLFLTRLFWHASPDTPFLTRLFCHTFSDTPFLTRLSDTPFWHAFPTFDPSRPKPTQTLLGWLWSFELFSTFLDPIYAIWWPFNAILIQADQSQPRHCWVGFGPSDYF